MSPLWARSGHLVRRKLEKFPARFLCKKSDLDKTFSFVMVLTYSYDFMRPMSTRTQKYWDVGVTLAGACFGISVMFGHIPGLGSDVGTFRRIAGLTQMAANENGYLLTGLGAIVSGVVLGVLCLVGGEGSPDSSLGID